MVNISANINKTKNHLSSQLIVHKTIMEYDVLNAGPGLVQALQWKSGEVKLVLWVQVYHKFISKKLIYIFIKPTCVYVHQRWNSLRR